MTTIAESERLPRAFIWRRLHSLTGLWLVLFLIEHLLTNSQAALLLGETGKGFVHMVNSIHNLPYLQVIEITLLGIPILIHMIWGTIYLFTGKFIYAHSSGKTPALNYGRNRAYNWQRITSWILLFLLTFHIVKFRFLEYPHSVNIGTQNPIYFVRVHLDNGLYTVADRLGVILYDDESIEKLQRETQPRTSERILMEAAKEMRSERDIENYDPQKALILSSAQKIEEKEKLSQAFSKITLKEGEVIAASPDFATASLLAVRDTFKNPFYVALYTIFVLSACFHGFNGFWTFLITWGWILKMTSQRRMVKVSLVLMAIVTFLGLASVWGTYWVNLRH